MKVTRGLIWFIATLVGYGLALYFLRTYEVPSRVYHVLLLAFPVALIVANRNNVKALGLVKGDWKQGLGMALVMTAVFLGVLWFRNREFTIPVITTALMVSIIFSPIAEELFFRGFLQPELQSRTGRWLGLVTTAVLFMVIHIPKVVLTPLETPAALPALFGLGLVFGYIRDESRSVYFPIICHGGYNLVCAFF